MADWLECMHNFCRVAEEENFSAAARRLQCAVSLVSKRVQLLEEQLGVKLFNRSTRHVQLTEQGQLCYQHAMQLLEQWQAIQQQLQRKQGEIKGQLRIGTTTWVGPNIIYPLLAQYQEQHPQVNVKLVTYAREMNFFEDELDIIIARDRALHQTELVTSIPICTVENKLFCAKQYAERFGLPKTLAELTKHRFVMFGKENNSYQPIELNNKAIKLKPYLYTNNVDCFLKAIQEGKGIACTYTASFINRTKELINVLPEYSSKSETLCVFYNKQRYITYLLEDSIDFFVKQLTEQLKP